MAIPVKLQAFEGPLDLLLHLIEKNKIDIYDIPIAEITDQYLAYVQQMDHEDMDVTSEFMVMAATLIDIKCRMLLPLEVTEEVEEEDPREELVRQLLEYKMYKNMAGRLRDCMDTAGELVSRKQSLPEILDTFPVGTLLDRGWPDYMYPYDVRKLASNGDAIDNYVKAVQWHAAHTGLKAARFVAGSKDQVVLKRKAAAYPSSISQNQAAQKASHT